MKFLPQKARTKSNNADLISDLSDELESIYSTSLTDVHAVRRSYTNNTSGSRRILRRWHLNRNHRYQLRINISSQPRRNDLRTFRRTQSSADAISCDE